MPAGYLTFSRILALVGFLAALGALAGIAANVPLLPIAVVLLALAILVPI
jgi:hypothetical protein